MKKIINIIALAIIAFACNKSEKSSYYFYFPDQKVLDSFTVKYPGADDITWQPKGKYQFVTFEIQEVDSRGWFNNNGDWIATYTESSYTLLPNAVTTAFTDAGHQASQVTEVLQLSRAEFGNLYIISIMEGTTAQVIYFNVEGNIEKTVSSYSWSAPSAVEKSLTKTYPGYALTEFDKYSDGSFEADIIDNSTIKRVFFNASYEWIRSYWMIAEANLPEAIKTVIATEPAYEGYSVNQVLYTQYPDSEYYHILFSKEGSAGLTVDFLEDGTVVSE